MRIKKILLLGVFLLNLIFIESVYADEVNINIVNIKQGDNVLSMEDDMYIAPGYEKLSLEYNLSNYDGNEEFYYEVMGSRGGISSYSHYIDGNDVISPISAFGNEIDEYTFKICESYECNTVYAITTFKIKFLRYEEVSRGSIKVTSVRQGSKEIVPNDENKMIFNNRQNVVIHIKGTDLVDDAYYEFSNGTWNDNKKYLGSELNSGIDYVYNPNNKEYFYLDCHLGSTYIQINYLDNPFNSYTYEFVADTNLGDYNGNLIYTNYKDNTIDKVVQQDYSYYVVKNKYHNKNNTLSYKINGSNYQDKEYNVKLNIIESDKIIYSKDIDINGLLLNKGYELELDNLLLESGKTYSFNLDIDSINSRFTVRYVDKSITIKGINQGDETLTKVNGAYVAPGLDYLEFLVEVDNYNNEDYYVSIASENSGGGNKYSDDFIGYVYPDFKEETVQYNVLLCDDWECNNVYASELVNVKFSMYNQIKNGKIYFSNIKQGDKDIVFDKDNYSFTFNNKQDITFTVKGENLIDDATYRIECGNNWTGTIWYTGLELEKGITYTYHTNKSDYFYLSFFLGNSLNLDRYYDNGNNEIFLDGDNYNYFNYNFENNYEDGIYDAKLMYTNYEDKVIEFFGDEYNPYYILNSNYFNKDNSLSYYIKGSNYQDKDYKINVEVKKEQDTIYTYSKDVNGLLLNNNYKLELKDFVLDLNKEMDNEFYYYTFNISIDYVSDKLNTKYNSIGKDASVNPQIFFENGKRNLSVFRGFGYSGIYDTNKDVFNKYSKIYINYLGSDFINDDTYEYTLEYGYLKDNSDKLIYTKTLKTGTVKGDILNNVGLFFELDNNNNYKEPTYRISIKKGSEILAYSSPVISMIDYPTFANASLKANSHNLYLRTSDNSYIATRNGALDIVISGLGFEEDKDYDVNFCYRELDNDYTEDTCKIIKFNGSDINNGDATINFNEKIDKEIKGYFFYVFADTSDNGWSTQGGFEVHFVDSKELIPSTTRYILDDASDLIKNVKKNTSVSDFKKNIEVSDNGSIKIFDKTGVNEVLTTVGTGMIGRIIDEYDRNVLDIDVVVNGDVNGDGNITLTDLVKVKKHLTDTTLLEGCYETAGDISNTGDISITDLVKMARDVIGVEEIG